tara:strand:+ start:44 stop:235 length:192 start_codon:yes stop_codon:yes gene_type:complete
MNKNSEYLIEDLEPQMHEILRNDAHKRLDKFIEFIDLYSKNHLEEVISLISEELSKRKEKNDD